MQCIQRARYLLCAIFVLTAMLVVGVGEVLAAEYYVRPAGGDYGAEDGSSYENAWDGFVNIDWAQLGAGDTLWLVGTFTDTHLMVQSGGDATEDLWIRGDSLYGIGIIDGRNILWASNNSSHITVHGVTLTNGMIDYANVVSTFDAGSMTIIAPDILRSYGKTLIARGLQPGMQLQLNGGGGANRRAYMVESIADQGDYEEIVINTTAEGVWNLNDEVSDSIRASASWPNQNITIDSSSITLQLESNRRLIEIKGDNFIISNNYLDGGAVKRSGMLYTGGLFTWRTFRNITIIGNTITNGNTPTESGYDQHCIGVQSVDDLVITRNILDGCGAAGIVYYHNSSRPMTGWETSYNLIRNLDHDSMPGQWGGSGIVFTGADSGPDNSEGYIANNTVAAPMNCPDDPDSAVACRGIRYKLDPIASIYNNNITGVSRGIEITGGNNADIQYNSVSDSDFYHIVTGLPTNFTQDHNLFDPDGATLFKYHSSISDFSGYKDSHPSSVEANGSIIDTHVSENGELMWNSPLVDSGQDVEGITIDCDDECTDVKQNPLYGPPDIGAIEYQPPYTMGTDEVDITSDVRVYGDGKFRNKETAGGTTADLSITPTSNNTREYLDIEITEWNTTDTYRKTWTETSDTVTGSVTHTVGDLQPNTTYEVSVDGTPGADITGCTNGVCTANGSGEITFTYTGTYSTHTFDVQETTRGTTLSADFNADDTVNIFDYNLLLTHFGATADCGNPADANGDCAVNIFDYNVLLGEFGRSV